VRALAIVLLVAGCAALPGEAPSPEAQAARCAKAGTIVAAYEAANEAAERNPGKTEAAIAAVARAILAAECQGYTP
jgi:hypothetical protein